MSEKQKCCWYILIYNNNNNNNNNEENLPNCGFTVPADNRVKLKRKISIWNLLDSWKNCGTWKWQWYQL